MKSSIMRGNFGLFCSFSQKLPRIHVGLDCNANEKTLTVKRAILYSLLYSLLLLIRDVWSGAASMEVLVYPTRESKPIHARVYYLGLETDVKLTWVIMA